MVVTTAQWPASWMLDAQKCNAAYRAEGDEYARPVSGDMTARSEIHGDLREHERRALAGSRRQVVAGGWLQRAPEAGAEGATRLRCEDCPWGLDVQGWDDRAEVAGRLALRHTETLGHTVTAAEVKA